MTTQAVIQLSGADIYSITKALRLRGIVFHLSGLKKQPLKLIKQQSSNETIRTIKSQPGTKTLVAREIIS